MVWAGNTKGGSITVLLTSCLTGLESAVWELTFFCFYLQNRLIQTSKMGGQRYSDTSTFTIPWCKARIQSRSCLLCASYSHFAVSTFTWLLPRLSNFSHFKLCPTSEPKFLDSYFHFFSLRPERPHPVEDDPNLSDAEKRHSRVKRWTKSINIFEKDFIVVPINEKAHWYDSSFVIARIRRASLVNKLNSSLNRKMSFLHTR